MVIWIGTLIYLNADNDIAGMLGKAKAGGDEILTPKTKLSDQFGFIAVFFGHGREPHCATYAEMCGLMSM